MAKIRIEDIKETLSLDGWKLLSEEYENLESEMVFECNEGHTVFAPWKKIRTKRECPTCKKNIYKFQDAKIVPKPKGVKRVLALDQATHTSGYAIFDNKNLVKYGSFTTNYNDEIERDHMIKMWLISLISTWKPDYVAIEGIQFQEEVEGKKIASKMSVTVFQALARLQGILMETCLDLKVPYEVCPTNTWRKHCGVRGQKRTDKKRSMQILIKEWYDTKVTEDEADAIGIGKYMSDRVSSFIETENWE